MQKKELRMDRTKVDQIIHEVVAKYFRKPLIVAGNWKMNMTVREGLDFLEKLGSTEGNVLIFPPYTTLAVLAPEMKNEVSCTVRRIFIMKTAARLQGRFPSP